jgi:hypothetical protein
MGWWDLAMKQATRLMLASLVTLGIAYTIAYLWSTPLITIHAGTLITPSCSFGAPLGSSSNILQQDTPCRVMKSYSRQVLFSVAFQAEAFIRGGRLLLMNKEASADR